MTKINLILLVVSTLSLGFVAGRRYQLAKLVILMELGRNNVDPRELEK